tara:strand:- start:1815 stop:2708 length:894 start_codon:yes stop_codon:yes gene_type:complete
MRIGVTGASGMLGNALLQQLSKSYEIFATSRNIGLLGKNINWECFDLTNLDLLKVWLDKNNFDIVIHCAAIVDVDFCEENIDMSKDLHVETTKIISNYMQSSRGKLIYISTDSVFDGKKSGKYNETENTNPLNVYAKTKLQGEQKVLCVDSGLVLRTNIIGWTNKNKTSFFEWLLENLIKKNDIKLFDDVYFSPLTVHDLSLIIEYILINPIYGLYNCANSESISKYDFALKVCEVFNLSSSEISRVSVNTMNFKAKRPKNMGLDVSKLTNDLMYNLPNIIDSIKSMESHYKEVKNF